MKKLRFINGSLAGDLYVRDAQAKPGSAAIFLYGFPAFVGPNAVTKEIVEAGLLAFQPHYIGSYDSSGTHTPEALVETCRLSDEVFKQGYVTQSKDGLAYALPARLSVCVAHSFGCLAALRSIAIMPSIETLVLLGPAVHYSQSEPDFGLREDGLEQLEYVRRSHPNTYRLSSPAKWAEILSGADPLPHNDNHPSLKRVIALVGSNDKYFDKASLKTNLPLIVRAYCGPSVSFAFQVVYNTGHSLDDLIPAIKRQGLLNWF